MDTRVAGAVLSMHTGLVRRVTNVPYKYGRRGTGYLSDLLQVQNFGHAQENGGSVPLRST